MRAPTGAWERFWYAPTPTSTLAVVRVAYGALLVMWTLSLPFDLASFFSASAVTGERPHPAGSWSVLDLLSTEAALVILFFLLVIAATCLMVGFHTRLAAVVAFVVLVSFHRQNPFVLNGGDTLLRIFGFLLMLAPAGVALSVDRWRSVDRARFWEFPPRAPWPLRLMQLQISAVYLFTVWLKLRSTGWNDGTVVSYVLRLGDLTRLPLPSWFTESLVVSNVLTLTTLGLEVALAILVWNRRARPWVLGAGVVFHLLIDLTLMFGFFSLAMFVGYLAFIPADTMERTLLTLRARLGRSRLKPLRRLAAAGPETKAPSTSPSLPGPRQEVSAGRFDAPPM